VRDIFNQELKQLGSDLETMARQVATAIERAAESLSNGDIIIAEQVIDADERINDLQRDIDDMCVMLLARQQPVADNLRTVISALRMAQTLERQGDLARHLATIARGRYPEPPVPEDVKPQDLEASARRELRALGRANAENVARHLVMLQRLLDTDPELAHQHARYAASHAGRVAVVRESAGIAAYLSGHYQEALRDIRAARRLSGLDLHRAIEADCERALGNLDRALKAAQGADPAQLDDQEEAEIAMVVSGVRHEMGQTELGLVVIEEAILMFRGDRETLRRLHSVRADRLEELGRVEEAEAVRVRIGEGPQEDEEEDVEVYDVVQEADEEPEESEESEERA